jgi:LPXTG-motif cell wall-anchored protein
MVGTATLEPGNGWQHIFRGLPKVALDEEGNKIGEYGYYVEEVGGEQYHVVYKTESGNLVSNDAPVSGGRILVQNTITEDIFSLPETGGYGRSPLWYILGGLLLSAGALLLYRKIEIGREGNTS